MIPISQVQVTRSVTVTESEVLSLEKHNSQEDVTVKPIPTVM